MTTTNTNFKVKNGLDASGDITTYGALYVNGASGSEGGQIELAKAPNGTTNGASVVIDVYDNKLRFFEKDSPNRGAYIDLTATSSTVGTNLLGGTAGAMNYAQTIGTKQSGISATGTTIVSLSITTNGYPVLVTVSGDVENNSAGGWTVLQLYRGSTAIGNPVNTEGSAGSENSPYSIHTIDTPAAGTYTYALKLNTASGGTFNFGESNGPVITAVELSGPKGDTGATGASGGGTVTSITAGTTGLTGGAITTSGTIDIDTTKVPQLLTNTNTFAATTGATKLVVKQGATQSTTNLQEWQNTSGTALAYITSSGGLNLAGNPLTSTFGVGTLGTLSLNPVGTATPLTVTSTGATSNPTILAKASSTQTGDIQQWWGTAGSTVAKVDLSGTYTVGTTTLSSTTLRTTYINLGTVITGNMMSINSNGATQVGLIIRGNASQTADLQQWQTSASSTVSKIDKDGNFTATSIIKTGGTSSQFLKADGSVDSSTYLTSAVTSIAGTTNQITASASTGSVTLSLPTAVTLDTLNVTTLNVSGTQNIIDTTNLSITDSLIYLSSNQYTTDAVDIGIYGAYGSSGNNSGNHPHTGIVRDASDGVWKLVSGAPEPSSNVIDFTSVTYDTLLAGSFKKNGGTSSQFLKADGSIDSSTYLTSYSETDTLSSVTGRGATTSTALTFTNSTDTTTASNGALVISGGLNVLKNANIQKDLYVGASAITQTAVTTNPSIIAKDAGSNYAQIAMINSSSTGSADFAAYGDNGSDSAGWVDMGFTGSGFNDTNYTITGKNDGYIFTQAVSGAGLTGNLVLATGNNGTTNDIVFGTGGFTSDKEKMRFVNSTGTMAIKTTTSSTTTTTGALTVAGGVGISENLNVGGQANAVSSYATTVNVGGTLYVDTITTYSSGNATKYLYYSLGNGTIYLGGANSPVIAGNSITANSFVKSGGTGSQALMADGTVGFIDYQALTLSYR